MMILLMMVGASTRGSVAGALFQAEHVRRQLAHLRVAESDRGHDRSGDDALGILEVRDQPVPVALVSDVRQIGAHHPARAVNLMASRAGQLVVAGFAPQYRRI